MIENYVLDEVARICREVYIDERVRFAKEIERRPEFTYRPGPKWDGGEDRNGRNHKPIWPKIAQFMLDNKLEPFGTIRMRFQMAANAGKRYPPFPNNIALQKYLPDYKSSKGSAAVHQEDLETTRNSEAACCRMNMAKYQRYSNMTPKDSCAMVLLDEKLPISPLMRYCVAFHSEDMEIAIGYYHAAAAQYMLAPDGYDEEWGALVPDSFTSAVRASHEIKRYV